MGINVLHICNNFLSSTVHQKMAEALRKMGVKTVVFAPVVSLEGRVVPHQDEYAVKCVNPIDRYVFDYKQAKIYWAMEQTVPLNEFDLVHTHCVFSDGNAAFRLKRERGIPYLVTVNNTDLNHFFRIRLFLRRRGLRIMKDASFIVFIAEPYRKKLFETYIPERYQREFYEKSRIIPFGIDDFWFQNICHTPKTLQGKEGAIRLIFAGDINKNKNLELIVDAIGQLRRRGRHVVLTVAGNILDQEVYRVLRENSEFVDYAGLLSKEELLTYYRQSDIFVMPSHRETFGLVYAEAMSQGLPVLYTRGQGFDEQFPDGTVGYAVSDTDPEELAEKIELTADHYTELSVNCIRLVSKFSWNSISEQYHELYQSVRQSDNKERKSFC